MRLQSGSALEKIARIASSQHGVVTRAQLLGAGLSSEAVQRRVSAGLLHRVHRGVYRVGHMAPSLEAKYMAAVLACGEGAALSGRAAAFLYGLIRGSPPPPEVTSTAHRRVAGLVVHRVRGLARADVTRWRGLPITTVPRTLVDLAAYLSLDDLARACHEAEVRYGVRGVAAGGAPGAAKLRAIFEGDFRVTLSELERLFLEVLRAEGMPLPNTNRPAGRRYVDCRWPEHRLTVELDGYTYHHSRHAWERDRRREREARAREDEFRRYTYGDVSEDRTLMIAELRKLFG
jgi:very-short-patch-repair endonuclease